MVFIAAERVLAWWSGFGFELHTEDRIIMSKENSAIGTISTAMGL
jgi:hypothetical protein